MYGHIGKLEALRAAWFILSIVHPIIVRALGKSTGETKYFLANE